MREEYETILRFFASDLDRIATRNNILKMMRGQRLAKALGRNFFGDLMTLMGLDPDEDADYMAAA